MTLEILQFNSNFWRGQGTRTWALGDNIYPCTSACTSLLYIRLKPRRLQNASEIGFCVFSSVVFFKKILKLGSTSPSIQNPLVAHVSVMRLRKYKEID